MRPLPATVVAIGVSAVLCSCGPDDERAFKDAGDTPRGAPAAVPTRDVPPDSTTGVARSSGRPGVAGDTVSRSSNISAPPGKSPDPRRP
ncbi:MAG: hypothetical protein M3303_07320 [Gemmatimonadota bacterium]|nr:hypothetical protein [Gemmatimonadota bacterium]